MKALAAALAGPCALSLALLALPGLAQPTGTDPCLPALGLQDNGDGSFTLAWQAIANATAYQVAVRQGEGDWVPLTPQVPPSATQFTYQGQAGVTYHFSVVALHGGSNPIVTFCTVSNASEAPPCPTGLRAVRDGSTVHLEWDAVASADGYNAYGPTQDGPNMFLGHTQATSMAAPFVGDGTYTVNSTAGGHEAGPCPAATLAQVPFFPPAAAWASGLAGAGVAALVLLRRRA
jgi:hypothetical protein